MKSQPFDVHSRVADVLDQPGPPFQNWLGEVGLRLSVLLTTLAQLSELVVSKCPKCKQADSWLWFRVGDHQLCTRLEAHQPDEPLPPFG